LTAGGRRRLAPALQATIGAHAAAPFAAALPHALPWVAGALAANHAILALAGMIPRSTLLGPNMTRLPDAAATRRQVALTFDDGPDPEVTPRVLDILDTAGARASFFCIGRQAERHRTLVREIVRRGHSVENHSYTHPNSFACRTPQGLRQEVGRAQAALSDISGVAPAFFRAPMGLRSPLLDPVLASTVLHFTSWTRRALDGVDGDPGRALRRLTSGLAAGDILLMHDGRCARTRSQEAVVLHILPGLLRALAEAGLEAVPMTVTAAGSPPPGTAGAASSVNATASRSPSAACASP